MGRKSNNIESYKRKLKKINRQRKKELFKKFIKHKKAKKRVVYFLFRNKEKIIKKISFKNI